MALYDQGILNTPEYKAIHLFLQCENQGEKFFLDKIEYIIWFWWL
jgi:hypothetical protein